VRLDAGTHQQNLAAAVERRLPARLVVGLLSASVMRSVVNNPLIPNRVKAQVDLDNITHQQRTLASRSCDATTGTTEAVGQALVSTRRTIAVAQD